MRGGMIIFASSSLSSHIIAVWNLCYIWGTGIFITSTPWSTADPANITDMNNRIIHQQGK